ncbi:MAG: hypothetical protein HRT54_15900 [Colwellia sp.]|nr:hypothetical protein [Colwellia sp.]
MKTLLITTLTTALLSFNSFADNTANIQYAASQIAEEGLQQLNTKLALSSTVESQDYLNALALTADKKSFVLVARVAKSQRFHTNNTIQSEDE